MAQYASITNIRAAIVARGPCKTEIRAVTDPQVIERNRRSRSLGLVVAYAVTRMVIRRLSAAVHRRSSAHPDPCWLPSLRVVSCIVMQRRRPIGA